MCGITGIYAFNLVGKIHMVNLVAATEALAKRGPDFQQVFNDDTAGLGHRRLSVIDTSAKGHQPMCDANKRYWIIFNGEIYNYRSLRKDLENQGMTFRSQTDTEVLLQLFIKEGEACLQKLNGFFAFAIYDQEHQRLFVARDRLGIKPLYFLKDEDKVIFASELKSLLAYGVEKKINYNALLQYLQLNYIPAPQTILQGVRKLSPGSYLEISSDQFIERKYYQLSHYRHSLFQGGYEDQQQKLKEKLEQAVQRRLVADVPLGAFLSGGIDSSVIAGLARRHKPDLHTFSIGYRDEKYFDETHYARLVAKHFQTEHTVFSLTNRDLYEHVYHLLDYFDEPFADSSAIAVYILSRETRKHATVALSGDGADELFSGYNKHAAFYKFLQGNGLNQLVALLHPLWKVLPKSRNNTLTNKIRQLHRFSAGSKISAKERYWRWAGFATEEQAIRLMSETSKNLLPWPAYNAEKSQLLQFITEDSDINPILLTDTLMVLPDDMLTKVDRMSMANSLEVRVPFLDHEMVEFAFSLPGESKINGKTRKRILRDAYKDMLPAALYNRPKKGFEVPLLKWFRKEMRALITDDLLAEEFVRDQGVFEPSEINRLIQQLFSSSPGDVHARIWGLIVFQWWWKKYFL